MRVIGAVGQDALRCLLTMLIELVQEVLEELPVAMVVGLVQRALGARGAAISEAYGARARAVSARGAAPGGVGRSRA